jgi:hypothetical protein
MSAVSEELKNQIEAAYDYRGHVTVHLNDGSKVEGFLYNRQFPEPLFKGDPFIDLFLKGSGDARRLPLSSLRSIELTGEDCAAGKSYEDYLKKKQAQQS